LFCNFHPSLRQWSLSSVFLGTYVPHSFPDGRACLHPFLNLENELLVQGGRLISHFPFLPFSFFLFLCVPLHDLRRVFFLFKPCLSGRFFPASISLCFFSGCSGIARVDLFRHRSSPSLHERQFFFTQTPAIRPPFCSWACFLSPIISGPSAFSLQIRFLVFLTASVP